MRGSQIDLSHGGTDARGHRQGRGRGSVRRPGLGVHGPPCRAGLHPTAGRALRGPSERVPRSACGGATPPHCQPPTTGLGHVGDGLVGRPFSRRASIPCTLCKCFALDRKILTTAAGYRAGSNHSIPVPPSTYGGVVPRPGSRDGCPVGSLRHRAPVQGLAGIAAEPSLSSDTFTREEAW